MFNYHTSNTSSCLLVVHFRSPQLESASTSSSRNACRNLINVTSKSLWEVCDLWTRYYDSSIFRRPQLDLWSSSKVMCSICGLELVSWLVHLFSLLFSRGLMSCPRFGIYCCRGSVLFLPLCLCRRLHSCSCFCGRPWHVPMLPVNIRTELIFQQTMFVIVTSCWFTALEKASVIQLIFSALPLRPCTPVHGRKRLLVIDTPILH